MSLRKTLDSGTSSNPLAASTAVGTVSARAAAAANTSLSRLGCNFPPRVAWDRSESPAQRPARWGRPTNRRRNPATDPLEVRAKSPDRDQAPPYPFDRWMPDKLI